MGNPIVGSAPISRGAAATRSCGRVRRVARLRRASSSTPARARVISPCERDNSAAPRSRRRRRARIRSSTARACSTTRWRCAFWAGRGRRSRRGGADRPCAGCASTSPCAAASPKTRRDARSRTAYGKSSSSGASTRSPIASSRSRGCAYRGRPSATQAESAALAAAAIAAPSHVVYAACDFETESLADALAASGSTRAAERLPLARRRPYLTERRFSPPAYRALAAEAKSCSTIPVWRPIAGGRRRVHEIVRARAERRRAVADLLRDARLHEKLRAFGSQHRRPRSQRNCGALLPRTRRPVERRGGHSSGRDVAPRARRLNRLHSRALAWETVRKVNSWMPMSVITSAPSGR